jgi:hypothetical protein
MNKQLVTYILCGATLFFAALTCLVVYTRPDDGQLYTLFAAAFGNFSGGLMTYLQVNKATQSPTP